MNYLYQIKLDEIDYQITHIIFWGNVRKLQNFALEVGSQIHYLNTPRITLAMLIHQISLIQQLKLDQYQQRAKHPNLKSIKIHLKYNRSNG